MTSIFFQIMTIIIYSPPLMRCAVLLACLRDQPGLIMVPGAFQGPLPRSFCLARTGGFIYAMVSLLPLMWITFSAMDVNIPIVLSWFGYGLVQAFVAGIVFARVNL